MLLGTINGKENMKVIEKYKKLGVIKRFEIIRILKIKKIYIYITYNRL